jgi:hypothetical protein
MYQMKNRHQEGVCMSRKRCLIIGIVVVLLLIVAILFVLWGQQKDTEKKLHKFLTSSSSLPEVVKNDLKANYKNYIALADDTEEINPQGVIADNLKLDYDKVFFVYSYPMEKTNIVNYNIPVVADGQIIYIISIFYDKVKKICSPQVSKGISDWLNSLDYLNKDYLFYSFIYTGAPKKKHEELLTGFVEYTIGEKANGKRYYLDTTESESKILSKLSPKEQEFVKMGMREKISKLSDDNK